MSCTGVLCLIFSAAKLAAFQYWCSSCKKTLTPLWMKGTIYMQISLHSCPPEYIKDVFNRIVILH